VTLSVKAGDVPLPPQGVFDWHYIQCVITRFGTRSYKGFLDINFFVYPFKTASDDSDEEYMDNDDIEPPYPSYHFDRYLEEQGRRQMALDRYKEVLQWTSGIPSSIC